MPWLKLTQPDGKTVYVTTEQIVRVRYPIADMDASSTSAVVDLTSGSQAVRETVEKIMSSLLPGDDDGTGAAKSAKK